MRRIRLVLTAGGLCVGAGVLAGCINTENNPDRPIATPPAGSVVASPFSPAGIRVLPLTHFERTDEHGTRVLLFFEMLDQWGDTVKGAGSLEVRLSLPTSSAGADGENAVWEIDLADLRRNASLYDPSTRAYRLALRELPAWALAVADGGTESGVVGIEVFFRTVGADGRAAVLRDRFELRGRS
jgi:hypothetical protein